MQNEDSRNYLKGYPSLGRQKELKRFKFGKTNQEIKEDYITLDLGIIKEFKDSIMNRSQKHKILEICASCLNECKQHGADNLLNFICYDFEKIKGE